MKRYYDKAVKVSERPFSVGERVYMRIPTEKSGPKHPKLVNECNGPFRIIELTENSAVVTPIAGNAQPLKVQFDFLKRLPVGKDNEPIQTAKQRGKSRIATRRSASSVPSLRLWHLPHESPSCSAKPSLRPSPIKASEQYV